MNKIKINTITNYNRKSKTKIERNNHICSWCKNDDIEYIVQNSNWTKFFCFDCFNKVWQLINDILNTCNCKKCIEKRK